jgi:hypothetical protein
MGDCLRCGYRKGDPGEHIALFCHREPNSRMPRHISAVEVGKHDREDLDEDLGEDVDKRPRLEVSAIDAQIPLYEDGGYESEDRFNSD